MIAAGVAGAAWKPPRAGWNRPWTLPGDPLAAASITLLARCGACPSAALRLTGVSVSGCRTLAINKAAGAEIIEAVSKCPALTPTLAKIAISEPLMVAKPPTISAFSSLRVMVGT